MHRCWQPLPQQQHQWSSSSTRPPLDNQSVQFGQPAPLVFWSTQPLELARRWRLLSQKFEFRFWNPESVKFTRCTAPLACIVAAPMPYCKLTSPLSTCHTFALTFIASMQPLSLPAFTFPSAQIFFPSLLPFSFLPILPFAPSHSMAVTKAQLCTGSGLLFN